MVVVSDQMNVEIISIFCVIGVVNDGEVVELFDGLAAGLFGPFLQ